MHVLVAGSVSFRQLPCDGAVLHQSVSSITHPGVVLPLLGPCPLGIPTELPVTGVALPHGSSSPAATAGGGFHRAVGELRRPRDSAPIASTTSARAWKLWPLKNASQCGNAAT